MGRLMKSLRSTGGMIAIGFILLLLIVVLIGYLFQRDMVERVLSVLMVIVLWLMVLMYRRMQEEKHARSLESSLSAQAEQQMRGMRPEKRQELEHFKQELNTAIEGIKKRGIRVEGKSRSGRAALYALPWYVMIGPPGSGKSTAIKNSGLNFPLGDKELHGIGGTRNCDWFLSDSAILLDTAGRFVVEDDDHDEWLTFLDTLKKHRRSAPINGVIVGCSMQDLLTATPEELEAQGENIRKRIDELMNRLGIRFPVYLVFTKCDLLDGFVDFFETLERREREQIWGSTYTREQYENENPAAVFEGELQLLLNELQHKRLARLSDGLKHENRRKVFMFPLQVAGVKDKLAALVARIFQTNPYQKDKPICRGFYFTSGTQEGLPIDRAIEAISREFGLPPMPAEYSSPAEIKQYFIKNLLTDVIIADRDFGGGETTVAARLKRQMKLGLMAGAVLLLVLFLVGLGFDYSNSKGEMQKLQTASEDLRNIAWGSPDTSNYFGALAGMRKEIASAEKGYWGLGLSQRNEVLPQAYRLYFTKAAPFVEKVLFDGLARRMQRSAQSNQRTDADRDTTYDHLKAYLLLSDQHARLFDNEEYQGLLHSEAERILEQGFSYAPEGKREMEFFTTHFGEGLGKQLAQPFGGAQTPAFVTRMRAYIESVPQNEERRIYESLKRKVKGAPIEFNESPFQTSHKVASVFTKEGSKTFTELLDTELTADNKEEWVMGRTETAQHTNGSARPRAELVKILKQRYFKEYVEQWMKFVSSVQCQPFASTREAGEQLKFVADEEASAIIKFLKLVAEQTRFRDVLREIIDDLPIIGGSSNDRFGELNELVNGNKREELNALLAQLATLSGDMEAIAQDPTGVQAKDYAKNVLSGSATLATIATEVRKVSTRKRQQETRDALAGLFQPPMASAWEAVRKEAGAYLNTQWQKQVCEPFSELASMYPFNKGGQDAEPADVAAFFATGGPMDRFAQTELAPFFRPDNSWEPIRWQNEGIRLSGEAIGVLRQAKSIGAAIGGGKFNFEVLMQKPETQESIDKVMFDVGGTANWFEVKKQPAWVKYEWPGSQPANGAKFQLWDDRGKFQSDEKVYEDAFDKPWGWFRLLRKGRQSARTSSEYEVQWTGLSIKGRRQIKFTVLVRASGGAANPLSPNFFNFGCPAQITN